MHRRESVTLRAKSEKKILRCILRGEVAEPSRPSTAIGVGTQHQSIHACMEVHWPCLTASDTLACPPVPAGVPPQVPPH